MTDLSDGVVRQFDRLMADRGAFEQHWQECADYCIPNRASYTVQRSPGQKRMTRVYDSTAIMACEQFAAGLHSLLTSPTLRWFGLQAEDDQVNADDTARRWLDDASTRMYGLFNGPKHNFAAQSNELYLDLGSVGTAVMAVLESERSGILFSTRHLSECAMAENEEDRTDTLIRKWSYTARQAFGAWGSQAGEKVLKALDDNPDQTFEFLHAVRPRANRDSARADARHKPFESVYVSLTDKSVISVGGFDEFPYLVPRFSKSTGEKYGRSPAMTALPDIKMLNEMVKTGLMALQRAVDPPMSLPDDGYIMPIKLTPGARNFYRSGTRDRIEAIQNGGQVELNNQAVQMLRTSVVRAFYVEWMLMPSDPSDPAAAGKGVTATYTLQQRDEKMRLLSPMLARLQSEFLGPLIDRTFAIMWRRSMAVRFGPGSMLSPPPPILAGAKLKVEYVSPIAIAQKSSQLDSLSRLVQTAMMLKQADQNAPRILDVEAILRLTAADLSTPQAALKSPAQVQAEARATAEAQAQLNNHAALANVAGAAKDGTAAVKNLADAAGGGQPPQQAAA